MLRRRPPDIGDASAAEKPPWYRISQREKPNLEVDRQVPIVQTAVLIVSTLIILNVTSYLLRHGYDEPRALPSLTKWLLVAVVPIGILTAGPEYVGRLWAELCGQDYVPTRPMEWWEKKGRPRYQPAVVYVIAVLVLVAFTALVWKTGLGIESPYVPLASSPAVFGPFVARRQQAVVFLVFIVSACLCLIAWVAPHTACGQQICSENAEEMLHPHRVVYVGVAVTLLLIAGLISASRLAREQDLTAQNEGLAKQNEELTKGLGVPTANGGPTSGPGGGEGATVLES